MGKGISEADVTEVILLDVGMISSEMRALKSLTIKNTTTKNKHARFSDILLRMKRLEYPKRGS